MRLTKKLALQITEELWTWLAEEDGRCKEDWLGWVKYGGMDRNCALCELYNESQTGRCPECPYSREFGHCQKGTKPYNEWRYDHKKVHAQAFLKQIRSLR